MRTPLGTLILSCIVFVAFGILAASLGPVLPNLASNTASTLESTGTIFTAIFLGAFISQIGSGSLTDRIGPRPILIVGMILMSTGILGVSLSNSIILMLICGLIAGLGHGALDISVNTLIAKVFKDRSVAAVNLVNFFFGVGAIAGPALASLAIRQWNNGIPALWAGIALVILTIPFVSIFMLSPVDKPIIAEKSIGSPIYLSKLLWIAGLILFVYVGSETGMGGWTAAYMQQTSSIPADKAALIVSGFWMALTMGRLIAAFLGTRWTSNRLLSVSLAGASLGGLMLALSTGNLVITIIAV
ncbi:MAG TPA: MFS transporter, partial [Leptolinea sp.]